MAKYTLSFNSAIQAGYTPQQVQAFLEQQKQKGDEYQLTDTPQATPQQSMAPKKQDRGFQMSDLLPTAGGIVGGIAGSPLGPAGIIAGGAIGSGLGEGVRQSIDDKQGYQGADILKEGALGGIGGGIGMAGAKVAGKVASKLAGGTNKLAGMASDLEQGTRQIRQKASVYGAGKEERINQTLNKYGFKGTAQDQYSNLEPTMQKIEAKMQDVIARNPDVTVPFDDIKNSFLTKLQSSVRTRDITDKQAVRETEGYLNDLFRAAGGGGSGTLPRITMGGKDTYGDIPLATLRELKKLVNDDYANVYKVIERGGSLTPRQKVIASAWDSLDGAVRNASPEVKGLLTDESNLYRAAQSLSSARNNPPTLRVMGSSLPAGVTQKARETVSGALRVPQRIASMTPSTSLPIGSQIIGQTASRGLFGGGIEGTQDSTNNVENNGNNSYGYDNSNHNILPASPTDMNNTKSYNNSQDPNVILPGATPEQAMARTQSLTGYTPSELYQGYVKALTAGDKANANQLRTMFEDESKFQKDQAKTTESKPLSASSAQMLGKANAANAALGRISTALSTDPNKIIALSVPGAPGVRQLEADYSSISDAIGGLRTGASVSKEQQEYYRNLLPKLGDSPQTIQSKLAAVQAELQFYIQNGSNIQEPYGSDTPPDTSGEMASY